MESLVGGFRTTCPVHSSLQVPSLAYCTPSWHTKISSDLGVHRKMSKQELFCTPTLGNNSEQVSLPLEVGTVCKNRTGISESASLS